jgi:uncharacterized protein (TIGR03437 family)
VLSVAAEERSASLYDPESRTWNPTNPLEGPAYRPVLLPDGRVLSGTQAFGYDFGSTIRPVAVNASAASFHVEPLARGSVATVFGNNLSGADLRIRDSAEVNHPITRVFTDTPGQVNYLVPESLPDGQAHMTTASGNPLAWLSVSRVSPGLFTADASGRGVPAALALRVKADGSQSYEPVAVFDSATGKFVPISIDLGPDGESVFLVLFGTGIRNRRSLENVLVYIGGVKAQALYAGGQGGFDGLDQINVRIPRSLAGRSDVDVLVTVDGKPANLVVVRIE